MSVTPVTAESLIGESVIRSPLIGEPMIGEALITEFLITEFAAAADLIGFPRISEDSNASSVRGADMTLTNLANRPAVNPGWETANFDTLSLAAMPEPTFEDLAELDDEPRGTRYARCSDGNGTLSHLFFSDDDFDIARAKAICSKCGLREACLGGALERAEAAGVWGGELVEDGEVVVLKRRRGRPPKVARPVLVVDEVPLPPHLVA